MRITIARRSFVPGKFHLGRWSTPIGLVAVLWVVFMTVRGQGCWVWAALQGGTGCCWPPMCPPLAHAPCFAAAAAGPLPALAALMRCAATPAPHPPLLPPGHLCAAHGLPSDLPKLKLCGRGCGRRALLLPRLVAPSLRPRRAPLVQGAPDTGARLLGWGTAARRSPAAAAAGSSWQLSGMWRHLCRTWRRPAPASAAAPFHCRPRLPLLPRCSSIRRTLHISAPRCSPRTARWSGWARRTRWWCERGAALAVSPSVPACIYPPLNPACSMHPVPHLQFHACSCSCACALCTPNPPQFSPPRFSTTVPFLQHTLKLT